MRFHGLKESNRASCSTQSESQAIWSISIALSIVFGSLSGCAHWSHVTNTPKKPEAGLKSPKAPADAVAVDLIFLRLGAEQESELEWVWRQLDQQSIDMKMRRQLDLNGLRAGVIRGELPIVMQRWVEQAHQKVSTDLMEQAALAADVSSHVQKLQCRAGKRKEIVVRPQRSVPLVLLRHDEVAKGKSYEDPMLLFEMKTLPKPDGSASIRLTPEIQYGPMLPNFVGQDFAWHREFRRANDLCTEASVEAHLQPGEILAIAGTQTPLGIGEHFLWTETSEKKKERVVLLIRYTGSQIDELFSPDSNEAAKQAMEG